MSRKLPADEKDRRGTLRPSREKGLTLQPLTEVPTPPAFLSDRAAKAFHVFASILVDSGRLAQSDTWAVLGLAQAYTDWRDACDLVSELGPAYPVERKSPDGTPRTEWKANPAVSIRNEADKRCRNWMKDCGLTPSDRHRVTALQPAEDPGDPWAELLEQ